MSVVTLTTSDKYRQCIDTVAASSVITATQLYEDVVQITIISDTVITIPETIPIFIPLKINRSEFSKSTTVGMDVVEIYKQVVTSIRGIECTGIIFSTSDKGSIVDFWHHDHQIWINPSTLLLYLNAFSLIDRFDTNIKFLTIDPLFNLVLKVLSVNVPMVYNNISKAIGSVPHTKVVVIFGNNDPLLTAITRLLLQLRIDGWFSYIETNPFIPIFMKEITRAYNLVYVDNSTHISDTIDTDTLLTITLAVDTFKQTMTSVLVSDSAQAVNAEVIDTSIQGNGYDFNDDEDGEIIYMKGNQMIRVDNIIEIYSQVSAGSIPMLSINFNADDYTEDHIYTVVLDAFGNTSQIMNLTTFSPVGFDSVHISGCTVTLPISSKAVFDTIISNLRPIDEVYVKKFTDMDQALVFRAKLSSFGIRSITLTDITSRISEFANDVQVEPFTVCWFNTIDTITISDIEKVDLDIESVKKSLVTWIESQCREKMDTVSYNNFSELSPKELVEVVITVDGHGYEMETYSQIEPKVDPNTRKFMISPTSMKHFRGATGYFTVGPILGLYDTMPFPRLITIDKGHVDTNISNYQSPTQVYNQILQIENGDETHELETTDHKIVQFVVHYIDGDNVNEQDLVTLIVIPDRISEICKQLSSLWEGGFFLSPWAASYYQLTKTLSHIDPVIPEIFINSEESESR
jgi:hypothetical protein